MQIRNFLKESFIDFPSKISTIIFSPGCNYNCPSCHAKYLLDKNENIDEKIFFDYLNSRKDWLEGVVLCGGEPTLQPDLVDFSKRLKEKGLLIKLDTNGSNCEVLSLLKGIVDYVAMDVKAPKELYAKVVGKNSLQEENYANAIKIVSQFPNYEFRTTVVPVIRNDKEISFLTPKEIGDTAKLIYEITGKNNHKYFLQSFVPRKNELVNSRLENFPETPRKLLEEGLIEAKKYLFNSDIR